MKAAVLAYHSHNVFGPNYGENDHVSLRDDLETITRAGGRIVPLATIAQALREGRIDGGGELLVGLSFDDGPLFDVRDFDHAALGPQRGFLGILQDFREHHGAAAQPGLHATSFVIASPAARLAMQEAEEIGYRYVPDWLGDAWWAEGAASGLLEIGNHSWDHVHPLAPGVQIASPVRGDFTVVDTYPDANLEIRRASQYIAVQAAAPVRLFAYPYGHVNAYLRDEYLPHRIEEHGLSAAFSAPGRPVQPGDSPWDIPRVICGEHWRAQDALVPLMRGEAGARSQTASRASR